MQQNLEKHDGSFERIPNLICAKEMCSKCEALDDLNVDCKQCGKRTHVFSAEHPAVKFLISGGPDHSRTRFMSCNSRGYDASF